MIIKDQSNYTSDPIPFREDGMRKVFVGVTGPGPVALELLCEDNQWRSYPETTFAGPTAKVVTLPSGQWRVKVSGGPTTVQVNV